MNELNLDEIYTMAVSAKKKEEDLMIERINDSIYKRTQSGRFSITIPKTKLTNYILNYYIMKGLRIEEVEAVRFFPASYRLCWENGKLLNDVEKKKLLLQYKLNNIEKDF